MPITTVIVELQSLRQHLKQEMALSRILPVPVTNTTHTSKSTKDWLHQNKMKGLEWPCRCSDLNSAEHLWGDDSQFDWMLLQVNMVGFTK